MAITDAFVFPVAACSKGRSASMTLIKIPVIYIDESGFLDYMRRKEQDVSESRLAGSGQSAY